MFEDKYNKLKTPNKQQQNHQSKFFTNFKTPTKNHQNFITPSPPPAARLGPNLLPRAFRGVPPPLEAPRSGAVFAPWP